MTDPIRPVGVILAGGRSTRMQGPEKTLMPLSGKPMITHIQDRLARQTNTVIINANGDAERFAMTGLAIQADTIEGFAGPLAGVLAGMHWAKQYSAKATHVLTVAGDTPFFPADLAQRLTDAAMAESEPAICLAYSDGNRHPTFGLWSISLADDLERFLESGDRKVMLFAQRYNLKKVDFPLETHNDAPFDPFFNVNTPEDFAQAEAIMMELAS